MRIKDSKLKVQALPPIVRPASKGRSADNFRTKYLVLKHVPKLSK